MTAEPVANPDTEAESKNGLGEPETRPTRDQRGYFLPGNNLNPYGRKGNPDKRTAISELRRLADKKATSLAGALVNAAERGNVRAWVAMADRAYGVPAQKLVVEQAASPANDLMLAILEARGLVSPAPAQLPSPEPSQE